MSRLVFRKVSIAAFMCCASLGGICVAGMPAPLPSSWTKDHAPSWSSNVTPGYDGSADVRWQTISFFVVGILLSAWLVQRLWTVLRKDLRWLPPLSYGRALSFVVLWGLLFTLVLTMISGARELMTPGAWKQQGWTYKLAQTAEPEPTYEVGQNKRKQGLERLRMALWQYAAMHEGKFPTREDSVDPQFWNVPDWPGLTFYYVPGRHAEEQGRLLVFEPELEGEERQVLLTNGLIGTMRTPEIQQMLSMLEKP